MTPRHHAAALERRNGAEWFELVADEMMGSRDSGFRVRIPRAVERLRRDFPVSLHSVELSIGSVDPIDADYLKSLKELISALEPALVSDHLCWTGAGGRYFHELLPLPHRRDVATYAAERVRFVQDFLDVQLGLENPPNYILFRDTDMSEAEFLTAVAQGSGSTILLDLNNLHVSATNNGYDPLRVLHDIPRDLVSQFHVAGHDQTDGFLLDTHSTSPCNDVWTLYAEALERFGSVPTTIEWDGGSPSFEALGEQVEHAKEVARASTRAGRPRAVDRE